MLIQPIHINDVADAVVSMLSAKSEAQPLLALGPSEISFADYLASLARQLGTRAPRVYSMPLEIARISAKLATLFPQRIWTPDSLAMLLAGNSGSPQDAQKLEALIGRKLTPLDQFVATHE